MKELDSKFHSALPAGRMTKYSESNLDSGNLPQSPGIYRIKDNETDAIIYIGQTNNLNRRIQEHERTGNLDMSNQHVEYGMFKDGTSRDEWCNTEISHIERHEPEGNKYHGGNGRR